MAESLKDEVDQNYDFFQRSLKTFLKERSGEYVLLKSKAVVDFYDVIGDAYRAGLEKFPDGVFSIQQVTDEPVELGMMTLAVD